MHSSNYDEYADDGEYSHPGDYDSVEHGIEDDRNEKSEYRKHHPSAKQVAYRDLRSSFMEFGGMPRTIRG